MKDVLITHMLMLALSSKNRESPPELSLNWKLIQDKTVWEQTLDLSSIQYALQLIGFNAHGPKCWLLGNFDVI